MKTDDYLNHFSYKRYSNSRYRFTGDLELYKEIAYTIINNYDIIKNN